MTDGVSNPLLADERNGVWKSIARLIHDQFLSDVDTGEKKGRVVVFASLFFGRWRLGIRVHEAVCG